MRQLGVPATEQHEETNHKLLWILNFTLWSTGSHWRAFDQGPAAAKLLQSCPTLCDPIDGSPPGSSVPEMTIFVYKIKRDGRLKTVMLETRDQLGDFCCGPGERRGGLLREEEGGGEVLRRLSTMTVE